MPSEDLSRVQIDEFSRVELELAINRTRKLKSKTQRVNTIKDIAERVEVTYQNSQTMHSLINTVVSMVFVALMYQNAHAK